MPDPIDPPLARVGVALLAAALLVGCEGVDAFQDSTVVQGPDGASIVGSLAGGVIAAVQGPGADGPGVPVDLIQFDFEDAGRTSAAIEVYMEALFPGAIDVHHAISSTGEIAWPDHGSRYLTNAARRGSFEITFEDQPILAVRFEYHAVDGRSAVFNLRAYDDTVAGRPGGQRDDAAEVVRETWTGSGNSDWIVFNRPVKRLIFHDSGRVDVAIDDLEVAIPRDGD